MANTLIFLGSGASAPFGIPTMKGLIDSFENQLREGAGLNSEEMYDLYQQIKTSLKSIYGYVDLESVFTVIEDLSQNVKYSDLGFTPAYVLSSSLEPVKNRNIANGKEKRLANKLKFKIKELTRRSCTLDYNQDTYIKEVFDPLYKTIADRAGRHYTLKLNDEEIWYENWPIYTTNYDDVQEIYWEGTVELNDLVKEERDIQKIDLHLINQSKLKLVKLHGSLDWYKLDDGSIVKSRSSRIRVGGRIVSGEMMLYPLNQKDLYLHPWLEIFRGFKNDLMKTQNWVVIGYSFNDLFIREIFAESLERTKHNLIVVSPHASKTVEKKFCDIENIIPVDGKLEDEKTIAKIGDIIRPEKSSETVALWFLLCSALSDEIVSGVLSLSV